jgi:hypothetical protein
MSMEFISTPLEVTGCTAVVGTFVGASAGAYAYLEAKKEGKTIEEAKQMFWTYVILGILGGVFAPVILENFINQGNLLEDLLH